MKSTTQRAALAVVLGFGLVVSAAAQDRGPGPGGPAGPRGADRQKAFEDLQHRREQRLHDLLQIKPDQETAFRTFVASLEQLRPQRPNGAAGSDQPGPDQRGPGQRGRRGGGVPGAERVQLTTPERLDRSLQRLAEAQQRLQKQAAAVKTFYAALTADQRKVFDEFPAMGPGRGGFGGRGGLLRRRFEGPRFP